MEEKKPMWNSIDELLEETNAVHFVEVVYRNKTLRVAWKEANVGSTEVQTLGETKPYEEMTPTEKADYNLKLLELEALARITAAGEQKDCFASNMITKDVWNKFPSRIRVQLMNEMFELSKNLEKRF